MLRSPLNTPQYDEDVVFWTIKADSEVEDILESTSDLHGATSKGSY